MVKETPNNTSKAKKSTILGAGLYLLIIIISSLVLVFEPNDLDPKSMILPVVLGLFISALPLGCGLAAGVRVLDRQPPALPPRADGGVAGARRAAGAHGPAARGRGL